MGKKKTHEQYADQVKAKHDNAVVVIGEYETSKSKIKHECPKGHRWKARPNDILRGSGCPECGGTRQKIHAEYVDEVKAEHGDSIVVVGEYETGKTKILHKCECGHGWKPLPMDIVKGVGCPRCAGTMQKTHSEYVDEVKAVHSDSIVVLGEYETSKTKVLHKCECGHKWEALPNSILTGSGCPKCAGTMQKTHSEYVDEVKVVHGDSIVVLGEYETSKTKVLHQCECGHEWKPLPMDIVKGVGCPKCSGTMQKTHSEYVDEVKVVHGDSIVVTGDYETIKIKIEHECSAGHRWSARPGDILKGVACPQCSASKGEKRIAAELDRLGINYRHDRVLSWSRRKRYDFILEEERVLIEYDGIQHFRPVDYSSKNQVLAEKQFLYTQRNDVLKNRLAEQNGYTLIRLRCDEKGLVPVNLEELLREALQVIV